MMKLFAPLIAAFAFAGVAFADDPPALREHIEAHGPALTLSDVFENAGPAGARAVALAPPPGREAFVPARVIAAAAASAGLAWAPPPGLDRISVSRPSSAALPAAPRGDASPWSPPASVAGAAVRRGDLISLAYTAPGVTLTTRGRALEDGAVGQTIHALNLQSNHQIDVIVTGSGAAAISATN